TDWARCVSRLAHPGWRARCSRAARRHRDRHPAIDWVDTPGWTPRPASRIAAVSDGPGGDGPIPVVLARLCAVANRRARHRRLLEHADDLDSHRSATGDAIARDGDRDHVYRHWPGRCGDDRHPIGTSWTSGGDPYHGRSRHLRIKPGLADADQGASQPDSARHYVLRLSDRLRSEC